MTTAAQLPVGFVNSRLVTNRTLLPGFHCFLTAGRKCCSCAPPGTCCTDEKSEEENKKQDEEEKVQEEEEKTEGQLVVLLRYLPHVIRYKLVVIGKILLVCGESVCVA